MQDAVARFCAWYVFGSGPGWGRLDDCAGAPADAREGEAELTRAATAGGRCSPIIDAIALRRGPWQARKLFQFKRVVSSKVRKCATTSIAGAPCVSRELQYYKGS